MDKSRGFLDLAMGLKAVTTPRVSGLSLWIAPPLHHPGHDLASTFFDVRSALTVLLPQAHPKVNLSQIRVADTIPHVVAAILQPPSVA